MSSTNLHRVVIAGLSGDAGKSLVTLGVIGALRGRGLAVAPFKKGPDFIDAAWLGAAAGAEGRNLDTFMMSTESIHSSLAAAAGDAEIAVVEGNRGLFDGLDARGSHSTAQLAKLISAPLVLVLDATKTTRTLAALVLGCRTLDPDLELGGVVLNRVGTRRQERVIREAITLETGLPVLGAIPRLEGQHLPSRHLGLVTALEHPRTREVLAGLARTIAEHIDLDALLEIAARAGKLAAPPRGTRSETGAVRARVRIGVLRDRAFSFYYPENLAGLEAAGAELVEISPLRDRELPEIDALYAGGGFPEIYAAELSANEGLREELRRRIEGGLAVWAECGGLMYLSRALLKAGERHPMVGALPVEVEWNSRPQGHGYVAARVRAANPFLSEGLELRGHEFHYSRLQGDGETSIPTILELERGTGIGAKRDGLRAANVVATYTHLHALGTPQWAAGMVAAAGGVG